MGSTSKRKKGAEVRCVFSGVVSVITYMSGFGNTIIVDHNNGYYTVYAHLNEVLVKKFQIIDAGTVVGTVGDSGSLEGAMLHFEIYGNNKPMNPKNLVEEALALFFCKNRVLPFGERQKKEVEKNGKI